jgi:hypothetical protein
MALKSIEGGAMESILLSAGAVLIAGIFATFTAYIVFSVEIPQNWPDYLRFAVIFAIYFAIYYLLIFTVY